MTNDNNGRLSFKATIDDKDFNKKVDEMGKEVVGLGKTVGESSALLDKSIAQLTTHLGDLKKQLANTRGVEGIRQINIEIEKTQKEITRLSNIGKKGFDDLGNAIPKVSNETKKAGEEVDKLGKKIKDQPSQVNNLTKAFGGLGSMFKSIAASFGLFAGIQGVVSTIRSAVSDVIAFDKSMTNLSAIAGVSRSSLKGLESDIRKVASESINTATAVADMAMELIKLGTTPQGVRELLKPVNDLSIAFQASADATAVLLKGTLNAFQASESEAQRYADVMAMSANKTALGFQEIADSFTYISATANVAGYSIEETAAFMGVLVDNNVQASSAGRVLSSVFGRLAKGGKELEGELEKIRNSQDKLGQASKIFGAEGARLGVILANNKDRLAELNEEFKNSAGSLAKLTNQQLESVSAKWEIAVSAVQELFLTIDSGNGVISRFFKGFLDGIALVATKLSELGKTEVTGLVNTQLDLNRRITEILNVTAQTAEGAKERLNLIKELKREYPDFLAGIDAETISNQTLLGALQEINEEYKQRIILQGQTEGVNKLKKAYEEQLQMQEVSKRNLIELINLFNQKYDLKVDIDFSNIEKSTEQMIKGLKDKGVVKIPFFSDFGQLTSQLQQFKSNTANLQTLEDAYNRQKKSVDELRKSNKYLTVEEKEAMKAGQEYYKTLDEYGNVRKKNNEEAVKGLNEENNKTKERLALLDKIDKAERAINESVLSERETAIQKTLEKYRELNKEAVKLGMNTERIQELQSKELEVVSYKADTDKLKESLLEQRKLYEDFEATKLRIGEEGAKTLYSNLLDTSKNYYELLGSELDKIDTNDMDAKTRNRYAMLTAILVDFDTKRSEIERNYLSTVLEETKTNEQKLTDMRLSYAKKRAEIEANFSGSEAENRIARLDKLYQSKANDLLEDFASEKGVGSSFTNGVIGATKQIILAQISSLRGYLNNAKDLTKVQIDEIEKQIKSLDSKLYQTSESGGASKIDIFNNQLKSLKSELKRLEESKSFYESLGLPEASVKIAEIESNIAGVNAQITSMGGQKAHAIADVFGSVANELSSMSEGFKTSNSEMSKLMNNMSKIANLASNVASSYGKISDHIKATKEGTADFSSSLSGVSGYLGMVMSLGNIINDMDAKRRQENINIEREIYQLQNERILGEIEAQRRLSEIEIERARRSEKGLASNRKELEAMYNMAISKEEDLNKITSVIFDPNRVVMQNDYLASFKEYGHLNEQRYKYTTRKLTNEEIKSQLKEIDSMILESERKLSETGDDYWKRRITDLNKISVVYKSYMLDTSKTWQQLEKELLSGKVLEHNKALVEEYVKMNKELEQAGYNIEDIKNQMRELVTGTSISNLSDTFADFLKNGEDAVYGFGQTFEDVLKNAVVSAFKNEYIVKEMDKLFSTFGDMGMSGEFTQEDLDKLREESKKISESLQNKWDQISGALDLDFGTTAEQTMKDSVKRITEQQADRLVGITMGIQTMLSQNQGVNKKALETLITSQNLLNSSYQTLISIEANTRRSADGIDSINGKLDTIISNNDNSYTKSLGL